MKIICVVLLINLNFVVLAQEAASNSLKNDNSTKHSAYIELLGSGALFYHLTYECAFLNRDGNGVAGAIGFQYLPGLINSIDPHAIMIFSVGETKTHNIEMGFGVVMDLTEDLYLIKTGRLGYRFQKPEGSFLFKAAVTPLILSVGGDDTSDETFVVPFWPSLVFGWTFRK